MSQAIKFPGWKDLPLGADILTPGSARRNRTGDWRSERPEWDYAKCVQCAVCVIFCPEGCIAMSDEAYPVSDLDYCKGCGICQNECVTGCIHMEMEVE
jgi:pyruvate ferredoxin oxidoreductase delta subunit